MSKLEELRQAFSLATPGVWLSKDDHAPNMAAVGTGVEGWLGLAQMFGDTQKEANANAQFIALALQQGRRCLRVIHGKGHGSPGRLPVLKHLSRGWLAQREDILAFCQARPHDGGDGALLVLLQASAGPRGRVAPESH